MSRRRRPAFGYWLVAAAVVHGLVWYAWPAERQMNTVVAKRVTDVVELELLDDAESSTERQAPAAPMKAENGLEREQAEVHPWRKGTDASSSGPQVKARQTTLVTSKDDALPAAPANESVEAVSKAVNERESALENNGADSAVAPV